MAPVEITSVAEWNTSLRTAKANGRAVVVDFYTTWCPPCQQMAPVYKAFGSDARYTTGADFLKVNAEGANTRVIAFKYQIKSYPTFIFIRDGQVVDTFSGAHPPSLQSLIAKHAVVLLPPDAERAKAEGNKAFTAGDYESAVRHYTTAIEHAPTSAVLHGNRSISYLKLASVTQPDGSREENAENLRPKALEDAVKATELDKRWAKGWVRLAEALLAASEDNHGVKEELRAEGLRKGLEGVQEALETAIGLGEGKVKAEAQKMLDDVQKRLQAL